MSKVVMFARLNIQLAAKKKLEEAAAQIEELLYDAALEAFAEEDDIETFFDAKKRVVGISLPLEDDAMLTLEAGSVLGRCQMAFEQMDDAPETESMWFSIHEPDETTLETPNEPD